ncbi:hypothetical protein OYT1_ch2286 [Ferriphaselus amnicola]|uniref:Uncharacterized protein n=1 Tax=Ferriphaselus amnicola TaxID=1188319 RepID=A0A2Z6GEL6_9PROT|nr:hypothetical protein [Ferriphaselus amnicola]BBE51802.1 hypothetical protein OYT1_ch2286 [Ferriphaselus amnicola]
MEKKIQLADGESQRDLVNQLLGQIQMANSFARFADVVSLQKLKHIKETKAYKAVSGMGAVSADGEKIADVGTWEGFCSALGMSKSKVDEDLLNLSAFGEDALKKMASMGIGYRDLRQYRRLPDDDRAALTEAAKTGDKDTLLDLAETLIEKHSKEKAALKNEIATSETLVNNLKRNFDTVNNKKLALEDEVARLRPRTLMPGVAEFDARTFEVRHEAAGLEYGARIQMDALDTLFIEVLQDAEVDAETESLRLKAVGLAAGAMLARALDLYERVKEGLGGEMPVKPHGDLMLTSDEKDMLHAGVMLLNANFERGREARKMTVDDEVNKHRTGPGRRKGSKNKSGGEK